MKRLVIGSEINRFEELDSTNGYLSDLCRKKDVKNGSLVIAGYQTSGRGQENNTWYSSAGKNLLFSIFINTEFIRTENQFLLHKFVSLGIADFLKKTIDTTGHIVSIKWPNDIYLGNKKAGGILIQNQIQGKYMDHTIIGIGLNINEEYFPQDIPNPVSLFQITGKEFNLNDCLESLLDELDKRYQQIFYGVDESIHSDYLKSLYKYNEKHRYSVNDEIKEGIIRGINEYGKLIIEFKEGNKEFDLKEIEFMFEDQE